MQYISPITKDNDIVNKKYVDNIVSEINTEIENIETQIGNLENLETEDKSSLVNAINEVKASAGGDKTIDGIPVDLTGIYNTQVIGYDETQGKLVPMSSGARTEKILPNAIIPVPWNAEIISDTGGTLQGDPNTFGVTGANDAWACQADFTKLFVLSGFTNIYVYSSSNETYYEIYFSKSPNFETIDAQYLVSSKEGNCDITNLIGSYYMRVVFGCNRNRNATIETMTFS